MVTLYTVFAYFTALSCAAIVLYDGGRLLLAKRTNAIAHTFGVQSGLFANSAYTEVV
jgi:hypothetical protein